TWGDGSTTTVSGSSGGIVALGQGTFAVLGGHTYAEEGPVTLSVHVLDAGGASLRASQRFRVADAPLSGLALADPGAAEVKSTGTYPVATFTAANAAAPAADFTATVLWGDGSATSGSVVALGGGTFAVRGSHTYAAEGTCTLVVQVLDEGGA